MLEKTERVLRDPGALEGKITIVSGSGQELIATVLWDDDRVVRVHGNTLQEVLKNLEDACSLMTE